MLFWKTQMTTRQWESVNKYVLEFIYWVEHNPFTDPEGMLVCAEWHNLCSVVGRDMASPGSKYGKEDEKI